MSAPLMLRVVTYLLVCDGIAALVFAGLIGPMGAGLVVLAMLGSWWLERAREQGAVRPAVAWGLVAVAAVALAVDLAYLAQTPLDGMVHVLLFLILGRLFMRRALRDLRDAGYLSFFLLVATSSVTFDAGFFFIFGAFLLLGTWMLMLHHVIAESERAAGGPSLAPEIWLGGRNPLFRVSLLGAAVTFAIAGALFFVIPRVGQATLPLRGQLSRMVTGFSDRVDLGTFGEIETDKTVVMRVYVPDDGVDPMLLPLFQWRGIVFDRFDGRRWEVGSAERVQVRRNAVGQFVLGAPRGPGAILKQDVYLDPIIGTDVVFAAPRLLRLDLSGVAPNVDDMGGISVANPNARLHYRAESQIDVAPGVGAERQRDLVPLTADERRRYLQLPPLPARVAGLAREVGAGSGDAYQTAHRLNLYLSTRYRYTLAKPQSGINPVEEFLFVHRSGNCEYFAATLAVLLRALDIPSRVVGGFQRGDWNPYGRYFMVRLSDAHAWVEAYVEGLGWVTFDPSPRVAAETPGWLSPLALYLDSTRMRWYRYVINWSLNDQRHVTSAVQRGARDLRSLVDWPGRWPGRFWLIGPGVLAAGALLALLIRRRGAAGSGSEVAARPPQFYRRALRLLARRGWAPEPAETARQFWTRVSAGAPGAAEPLARITGQYERARFGATALSAAEVDELETCLARLRSLR